MGGLVEEGKEAIESDEDGAAKDVTLIGAALRVEHHEIAGYTAAISIANALGDRDIASLLNQTLEEEKTAGKNLLVQAKPLLTDAASEDDAEEEEDDDEPEDREEEEPARKSVDDEKTASRVLKSK